MNPTLEPKQNATNFQPSFAPPFDADDESNYPVQPELEDIMGETALHYQQIALIYTLLQKFFAARADVLTAANMTLYYDEGNPTRWFSPDVLVAFGVSNASRRVYRAWEERVFPQVNFEVASESTWTNDIGEKYGDYNLLGAEEYYLLDPERAYLPQPLMAFQRENGGRLLSVPIENGRVYSPRIGLEIVDTGKLFRFFEPARQEFLLTLEEAAAGLERAESEIERRDMEIQQREIENRRLQAEIERLQQILQEKQ